MVMTIVIFITAVFFCHGPDHDHDDDHDDHDDDHDDHDDHDDGVITPQTHPTQQILTPQHDHLIRIKPRAFDMDGMATQCNGSPVGLHWLGSGLPVYLGGP